MRFNIFVLFFSLFLTATASALGNEPRVRFHAARTEEEQLFKRKGGGGGGGRGGGSSGGGKSSGGSSSGSKGSTQTPNMKSNSNQGGTSPKGSGAKPNYGGFYSGGASKPYPAGDRSPSGSRGVGLSGRQTAFWPGYWPPYGMYYYPGGHYYYRNKTTDQDEDKEVLCGCAKYAVCGCDNNNKTDYVKKLLGDGSYNKLDKMVTIGKHDGKTKILVNGTLENGTTAKENADGAAAGGNERLQYALGLLPAAAAVAAAVFI